MFLRNIIAIFIFTQCVCGDLETGPIVQTTLGLVRGVKATDGDYNMFMGIPYAKVDENNPFGAAMPNPQHDGIFEANDDSAICPQIEEFNNTLVGSLGCLHMNVYVPSSASSTNRMPVQVVIYGGGFSIGFAGRFLYGPKYFMTHDIILVTFNYRLGPYGFMCLDIPEVPGNQGLKDQHMALKWIKANIEEFGGDSSKITIGGNSAGGMSVDFHLLHKTNETQLFHKAIFQSGTSLTITPSQPNLDAPLLLSEHFGFQTNNIYEAITFLATVNEISVIAAVNELGLAFGPCIEKQFDNVDSFISEDWIDADIPKVKDMPILIGFNDDELLSTYASGFQDPNLVDRTLNSRFDLQNEELSGVEDTVRQFYFGDEDLNDDVRFIANDFLSDTTFVHPTIRTVHKFRGNAAGNIFFYVFSHIGERNFVKHRLNVTIGGAMHADELGYLFDISYMNNEPTPEDQLTIDRVTAMWANFVKYGDPTPHTSELLPVKWLPNRNDTIYYLNIGTELSSGSRPFRERMTFWDLFYETYRQIRQP